MCCYCRDGACPVRVPQPPSVSLNPRPCPSTPVHITLSRPGPYARLRPLSSSSSHVPVLVPCPNTFQRRRCASQTKPMQECHPSLRSGSLAGQRSFAELTLSAAKDD